MKLRNIKLGLLFATSYIAVLVYPLSYFATIYITTQMHQLILIGVTILVLPTYIVSIKRFGINLVPDVIHYGLRKGRGIQRIFVGIISFIILGLLNALVATVFTQLNVVPFAQWNPVLETVVLLLCLFALLLQVALIHSYKERIPDLEEIEEAYDRAEEIFQSEIDIDDVDFDELSDKTATEETTTDSKNN